MEGAEFIYVGERSFWRYRTSGWGLIVPSIDAERLRIGKNTVARMYVSYDKRLILLKIVDTRVRDFGFEEEVLSLMEGRKKEDIEKVIERLQNYLNEVEKERSESEKKGN